MYNIIFINLKHGSYPPRQARPGPRSSSVTDDDEMWRQRRKQHTEEMAMTVERARQRRAEEEKHYEQSKQCAQEKAKNFEKSDKVSKNKLKSEDSPPPPLPFIKKTRILLFLLFT